MYESRKNAEKNVKSSFVQKLFKMCALKALCDYSYSRNTTRKEEMLDLMAM